MTRLSNVTLIVLLLLCVPGKALKSFNDYGPTYFEPTEKVITPHIRWAKPLEGGPLRVLFITGHKSTREIIELAQRLDMDYQVFTTENKLLFMHPDLPVDHTGQEDYEKRLREKLSPDQDYELIVVANIGWDILPAWSREEILGRLKGGTGLLSLVEDGTDSSWLELHGEPKDVSATQSFSPFPYLALPKYATDPVTAKKEAPAFMREIFEAYQYGDGRVGRIKRIQPPIRQMITPGYVGEVFDVKMIYYDYHLSLAIRLMRWAANRVPEVRVRAVRPWRWCHTDDSSFDRDQPRRFAFRLEADRARNVKLQLIVRNIENEILGIQDREVRVVEGDNVIHFDPVDLPAGVHFADLWVYNEANDRVIDFGSLSLEVHSDTHLRGLTLSNDHFKKNDDLTGHVLVMNPSGEEKMLVDRFDNFGRWTGTRTYASSHGGQKSELIQFRLDPVSVHSVRQVLRVRLIRQGQVLDQLNKAFSISDHYARRDIRSFLFAMENGNCYMDVLFMREVAKAGFDTILASPDTRLMAPLAARANLYRSTSDFGPGSAAKAEQTDAGPARYACLTDPNVITEDIERAARILAERIGKFSNNDISLASEGGYMHGHDDRANACFSPTCIASFQRWLKRTYQSIDAVNAEYETDYDSWEEVIPVFLSEARSKPSLLPLWVDHRRHMETVWAGFFKINTKAFRSVISNARVGYQCSGSIGHGANSYAAVDYWAMNRAMSLNCNYPGPFAPEAARDFMLPGATLGNDCWGGYEFGRHELFVKWAPWRSLLRGANTFLIFRGLGYTHVPRSGHGNEMTCVAPDLSWYPYMDAGNAEIREIKRGIGKLLMESRRTHDGIAVMYSASSTHVSSFTDGLPNMADTLQSFPYLFEDTGYQYRTVAYQQVAEGILRSDEFRVLYLPYCQAISRQEAAEITDFVKSGGTLIADLRPGVTDEHGKAYDRGILDEVFGVEQNTRYAAPLRGLVTVNEAVNDFHGRLILSYSDASLKLTTGRAHGGSVLPVLFAANAAGESCPAVVFNHYGDGTAVLLNFAISEYGVEAGYSRRVNELLAAILTSQRISPEATLAPNLTGTTLYRYQNGSAHYLGLLRTPAGTNVPGHDHGDRDIELFKPVEFTIGLPRKLYLYNMRTGEYLGLDDHAQDTLGDVTPFMLAALPYRVDKIALTASGTSFAQGETIKIQARVHADGPDPAGLHILQIQLFEPSGQPATWFGRNIVAEDGETAFEIPFALNAPVGQWRVTTRDAATGTTAEFKLTVTEKSTIRSVKESKGQN